MGSCATPPSQTSNPSPGKPSGGRSDAGEAGEADRISSHDRLWSDRGRGLQPGATGWGVNTKDFAGCIACGLQHAYLNEARSVERGNRDGENHKLRDRLLRALIRLIVWSATTGFGLAHFASGDDRAGGPALSLRCPRAAIEIRSFSWGSSHPVARVPAVSRSAGAPRDGQSTIDPSISRLAAMADLLPLMALLGMMLLGGALSVRRNVPWRLRPCPAAGPFEAGRVANRQTPGHEAQAEEAPCGRE